MVCLNGPQVSAWKACQQRGCANVLVPACVSMTEQEKVDNQSYLKYVKHPLGPQVNGWDPCFNVFPLDFSSLGTSAGEVRTESQRRGRERDCNTGCLLSL